MGNDVFLRIRQPDISRRKVAPEAPVPLRLRDQIITGDLGCFFDYRPGEFCIIHNWVALRKRLFRKVPFCGNSSCFRFDAGPKSHYIAERRELFALAGEAFARLEREHGFRPVGLNPVQRLVYLACRRGRYALARLLVAFT